MTRIEEIEKVSTEYRKSREECGVKDPILLDEVDDAYFMGAMWADEHPVHYDGKAYLYVLHKGVEQGKKEGKKEMLYGICEWLSDNLVDYLKINRDFNEADYDSRLFDDLKKAIEE